MQNLNNEFDYWAASVQAAEITWRIIWPIVFAFIAICWVIGMAVWRHLSARVFEMESAKPGPVQAIAVQAVEPLAVIPTPRRRTQSAKTAKAKTGSKSQTAQGIS
jgi:hypothetical protein